MELSGAILMVMSRKSMEVLYLSSVNLIVLCLEFKYSINFFSSSSPYVQMMMISSMKRFQRNRYV